MHDDLSTIGRLIAEERERRGWHQDHLARRAGIHERSLRRLERGESLRPVTLQMVLRALRMRLQVRLVLEGDQTKGERQ